eukprot:Cvel_28696.t1-p1 / transcript=Cvel_28696.t1 / gene=Cvel_28696 / organism=Chromera_velia_CCMP2878 / gene_product=hypothetical protein / transcript_product=hypothetical protein / location=Cvel_scaffold3807:13499-14187(+) / protein_length=163 / sequence_SO=supercontig / SO=protein_coding / is_pseudo=false
MMVVLKKIDSTRLKRFLIALHRVTLGNFDLYDAFRLWLPVVLGKSFHMCSDESDYPLYLQTKDLLVSYLPCIHALADGKPEEEATTYKLANVLPTHFAPVKQTLFDAWGVPPDHPGRARAKLGQVFWKNPSSYKGGLVDLKAHASMLKVLKALFKLVALSDWP